MGLSGPMISPPITPAAIGLVNESTNYIGLASVGTRICIFEVSCIQKTPRYMVRRRVGCGEKWTNRAQKSFKAVHDRSRPTLFYGFVQLPLFKLYTGVHL
jgi:hypothetical protein